MIKTMSNYSFIKSVLRYLSLRTYQILLEAATYVRLSQSRALSN